MACAVCLWHGRLRHGKDALCRYHTVVLYHRRTIVQRGILEEDIFQNGNRNAGVNGDSALYDVGEIAALGEHDESTGLCCRHLRTGGDNRLKRRLLTRAGVEDTAQETEASLTTAYGLKECSQLGLEEDDDSNHTHIDQASKDGLQKLHIEGLHDYPQHINQHNAREDVWRICASRHTIESIDYRRHKEYIDKIDDCKRYKIHIPKN